jgi:hypothetical protein
MLMAAWLRFCWTCSIFSELLERHKNESTEVQDFYWSCGYSWSPDVTSSFPYLQLDVVLIGACILAGV